jgi:hypothetical protein
MADIINSAVKIGPLLLVKVASLSQGIISAGSWCCRSVQLYRVASGCLQCRCHHWGQRVRVTAVGSVHQQNHEPNKRGHSNKDETSSRDACFFKEFMPNCCGLINFGITGVAQPCDDGGHPYHTVELKTGRPTRAIVHFMYQLSWPLQGGPILECTWGNKSEHTPKDQQWTWMCGVNVSV